MVIPAPWFWNQLHTSCWHLAWYRWLGDQWWKRWWSHWYCCHGFQKTPLDTFKRFSYAIGSSCKRSWQINFEEKNGVIEHQSKGSAASRHFNKKVRKCLVAQGQKASNPESNVKPMQGCCILSCLRVWQGQRQAWYLVLASVSNPFLRGIFVQLSGETVNSCTHRSMALRILHGYLNSEWNKNYCICSTDFDFLDSNIASCMVLLSKYNKIPASWPFLAQLHDHVANVSGQTCKSNARPSCKGGTICDIFLPALGHATKLEEKMPDQSPSQNMSLICVCVSAKYLGADMIFSAGEAMEKLLPICLMILSFDTCMWGPMYHLGAKTWGLGRDSCDGTGLRAHS